MVSVWVGTGVGLGVGKSVMASVTEAMVCIGVIAGKGATASVTEGVICVGKIGADVLLAHPTTLMDPKSNMTHLSMNRNRWMRRVSTNGLYRGVIFEEPFSLIACSLNAPRDAYPPLGLAQRRSSPHVQQYCVD